MATTNKAIKGLNGKTAKPQIELRDKLTAKAARLKTRLDTLNSFVGSPTLDCNNTAAIRAINNTNTSLNNLNGKTVTTYINTVERQRKEASGGVYNLSSPTSFLAGEAGPEVAAFFPMNNPTRSADLLAQLNAQLGGGKKTPGKTSQIVLDGSPTPDKEPANVTYNVGLTLPGGIVVSDVDKFGRAISPHIDRSVQLAERRRARGRPI